MRAAHRELAPTLDEGEALRQFGRKFVEGFRQTILGRGDDGVADSGARDVPAASTLHRSC
ncbi:MAG: DUF2378 family protein [Myxococcaceae bacterium]